jgi:hypothetical protein
MLQQERGATLVYVALVLPVLLALAGLAMDGSNLFVQQRNMQAAADAAALAGARAVALGQSNAQVSAEINAVASANGSGQPVWSFLNGNTGVRVETRRTFPTYFAGIMGHETLTVQATAGAGYFALTSSGDLLPMIVRCGDFQLDQVYRLWDRDLGISGSYGWLAWSGSGSGSDLVLDILDPSRSGVREIGEWLTVKTGVNSSSGVGAALNTWKNRPVTIPMFGDRTGTGSNTRYQICTFGQFVLLDYNFSGSNKWIEGRFIRMVKLGGVTNGNAPDFGVRTVRMVE